MHRCFGKFLWKFTIEVGSNYHLSKQKLAVSCSRVAMNDFIDRSIAFKMFGQKARSIGNFIEDFSTRQEMSEHGGLGSTVAFFC